ncbi:zinc metalloprotease [Thermococcus aciditolerans]|uniref:Site-2 protease family protein n=1 Tax=Thermococcus aciditolerans TaxID=2598455 RepID=A0A5C0SJX8_9EURY|nr:site-2 protease family protein [Thermococcus aciditolerans]QEK14621.1 site-2 protease family protein [Thermococcus aciditolerans]
MGYEPWKDVHRGSMGRREIEDLLISFLVLALLFSNFDPYAIPYSLIAVLTAFIVHELAHRQVARHYGYRAYYKRWDTGILMALLVGIATRLLTGTTWIFAALGAVQVHAPYAVDSREAFGRIALAGPVTNIAVGAAALVALRAAVPFTPVWWVIKTTATVNLWLAFFNLLPFLPLDGSKVVRWNAGYWAVSIGVAYLLFRLL